MSAIETSLQDIDDAVQSLQSFQESDPKYTNDKPDIVFKDDLETALQEAEAAINETITTAVKDHDEDEAAHGIDKVLEDIEEL